MPTLAVLSYSSEWPRHFSKLQKELAGAFTRTSVAIEHIGSTSIPGMAAIPIIDVVLGSRSWARAETIIDALHRLGFEYVHKHDDEFPMRRCFTRPASASPQVDLHAVETGSAFWAERLAFRDALRANPSLVAQYTELKRRLAAELHGDRPAYTAAKAPFIRSVLDSVCAQAVA